MTITTRTPECTARCVIARLYLALDLSRTTWKLAFATSPAQPPRIRTIAAGDLAALEREIAGARRRFGLPGETPVASCYEAGRDGFWVHRALTARGITNVVVDPSSIEVPRRARRAKTDRVDVGKLLQLLMRSADGEPRVWAVARVPSVAAEDRRQLHRELGALTSDATRLGNQVRGLLAGVGVRAGGLGPGFPAWLAAVRLDTGGPVPPGLSARVHRTWTRLTLVREQITALEADRRARLRGAGDDPAVAQVRELLALRGLGECSAWYLVMEVFAWRRFRNRREVGALLGLVPTPYASGAVMREQGISKAGNRRLRALVIQLAWGWLRYQPTSALAQWYQARFAAGGTRARRIGIVAVARRLWIALWRYLETGAVPDGALVKAVT